MSELRRRVRSEANPTGEELEGRQLSWHGSGKR
jgi:hypothetical protein